MKDVYKMNKSQLVDYTKMLEIDILKEYPKRKLIKLINQKEENKKGE